LDPVGGGLILLHRVPGTATGQPSSPSGLARTPDGRFVLMANRGPDTVSAFEVLRDASDGPPRLVLVDEIGCGGHNPRDITLIDGTVYVANQGSGSIAVLGIDPDTGALTVAGATLALPSPTHLLPSPAQVEEQP
jgi:6-phosphogluconolactonase